MQLKEKTVVVTGGSGGLGGLVCATLARAGARVVVVDRVPCDKAYTYVAGDLSQIESIKAVAAKVVELDPDVLINLAGIQFFGQLEAQGADHVALTYTINLVAPVLLTQALIPTMRRKPQAAIVNVGSTFGSIPFAHFVTYSSSKAGLKGFSEALRRELKGSPIQVTYVAPRAIRTPLNGPKVMAWAKATGMAMDAPELVASRIVDAVTQDEKDVYIGFPESLFVRVNALLPRVVDSALSKNDGLARNILTASENRT